MNKWEAEVQQAGLDDEKQAIKKIKEAYNKALDDVNEKIQELQNQITQLAMAGADDEATQSMIQSKVYQKQYQEAVRSQINAICDNITAGNYQTINEYLQKSYENGYVGTMYSLHNQGIPLVIPIDQEQVAKAIVHDTNLKDSLYSSLEGGTDALKKSIRSELSRGISQGMSYADISRNISNAMKVDTNKTIRIVRTEGHRINQESTNDAMYNAKDKGADIVKQWDATLDAKTRPSHQMVDGEIRELDEKFSNGLRYPGDPNSSAAEVINCRCVLLQRARWALDEDELNTLQERANYYDMDKTTDFENFKAKYLNASETMNYSSNKARKELSQSDVSSIEKADEATTKVYSKLFAGYQSSPLRIGSDSSMTIRRSRNNDGTIKYERYVSNIAIPSRNDHVNIGNDMLGNSLHERTHDIVTQIAMKRAGITDESHVTIIQDELYQREKEKLQRDVYTYCFNDESYVEITRTIASEISEYANKNGHELIAESFVQYLGAENPSALSKKVYDYIVKGWNKK